MKISVIIPTMNRPESLVESLKSLINQNISLFELIIIDQSTDNRTLDCFNQLLNDLNKKFLFCKYFHQEKPSLVMARNRGVVESTGDIISFIDDDIILDTDYFKIINKYFLERPEIGGLSGNVYVNNPRGIKWCFRKLLLKMFLINNFDGKLTISTFGYPIYEREISRVTQVQLFPGYSMNFRRKYIEKEICDENLSGYSFREDVDLSYRISRLTDLYMVPEARFKHNHSMVNRLDVKRLKLMQLKNFWYLFTKFNRNKYFGYFLFSYSLLGMMFVELLEFFFTMKYEKLYIFAMSVNAFVKLIQKKI